MPYNLFLLPLLGGFLFFHITHYFRFSAQRLDGYRLLLQAAIAGTCLAFVARILTALYGMLDSGGFFNMVWRQFSPFALSGTSALSLVLGPILALLVNAFVGIDKAKDIEIRRHGNALTKLLHRAQKDNLLISVTLDTRKWYVGWVAESPNLDPQELYFRLLPLTSGYRNKDTLETFRTNFYEGVLQDPTLNHADFFVTLPLKDVKVANLFNANVYDDYFAEIPDTADAGSPGHRHHEPI